CFYTPKTEEFPLDGGKILHLRHSLFDNDAIFLRDMDREVTLRSKTNSKFVRVSYPGMPYLGLWHAPKTDAPYICIEPWCSVPSDDGEIDDFERKRDMIHLAPGCTYQNDFNIEIG
ncbi:MAG: aldose 1-epimerase family protein, partial [bacterium]|nr:aldose 1-epimerase family protein [bacterium]